MAQPELPNAEALAAFLTRKAEIDELLSALQGLSNEHLGLSPEEIHWGHVGTLDEMLEGLRRIARFVGLLDQEGYGANRA